MIDYSRLEKKLTVERITITIRITMMMKNIERKRIYSKL